MFCLNGLYHQGLRKCFTLNEFHLTFKSPVIFKTNSGFQGKKRAIPGAVQVCHVGKRSRSRTRNHSEARPLNFNPTHPPLHSAMETKPINHRFKTLSRKIGI